MADNVAITPGVGATVATDQVGSAHYQRVKITDGTADSENHMLVEAAGNITAKLIAGTAAIGKLAANSGVVIGDVNVVSNTLATGAASSAKQDTGNSSLTSIDGKIPALGQALAAASVPVVLTAAQMTTLTPLSSVTATLSAETTKVIGTVNVAANQTIAVTNAGTFATQSTLQTGSNAIGKLAANSGVDIGDVDVTSLPAIPAGTNAIGKLLPPDIDITTHTNYVRKYYTNSGAVTDGIVWSPAAGKRWHITSLYFQTSLDATITFEDDKSGGDDPVLKGEFKAGSGTALTFDEKYPFASGEDAADLIVTTSAGNIYISVVGYEI